MVKESERVRERERKGYRHTDGQIEIHRRRERSTLIDRQTAREVDGRKRQLIFRNKLQDLM